MLVPRTWLPLSGPRAVSCLVFFGQDIAAFPAVHSRRPRGRFSCTQDSSLGVSECAPLRSIWPFHPPQHARTRLTLRPGTLARASCPPLPDLAPRPVNLSRDARARQASRARTSPDGLDSVASVEPSHHAVGAGAARAPKEDEEGQYRRRQQQQPQPDGLAVDGAG